MSFCHILIQYSKIRQCKLCSSCGILSGLDIARCGPLALSSRPFFWAHCRCISNATPLGRAGCSTRQRVQSTKNQHQGEIVSFSGGGGGCRCNVRYWARARTRGRVLHGGHQVAQHLQLESPERCEVEVDGPVRLQEGLADHRVPGGSTGGMQRTVERRQGSS